MFTIIRRFSLTHGAAGEVARLVQESFVPLLRKQPGFREYFLLDGGPDVLISIRVFDSADEALASNEIAASWDPEPRSRVYERDAGSHGGRRFGRRWPSRNTRRGERVRRDPLNARVHAVAQGRGGGSIHEPLLCGRLVLAHLA